jgi:hypothetical protein
METDIFKTFRQVIVWGFPLHSHTHSYIHGAWVKTFKHLGINVHWFHDKEYPKDFDYSNTCFITEGWADDNIPVNASSTYFVHIAKNPAKYISQGSRLIEIRYNVLEIHDFNYDYVLPTEPIHISRETLYERVEDDSAVAKRRGREPVKATYEVAYMIWATDILPHEFNYDDASTQHSKDIFYIGSIGKEHPFHEFAYHATKAGLTVKHIDPWSNPVSYEENIALMKQSYCCPDFRTRGEKDKETTYGKMNGTNHLDIGYIPCRVFKAISYGHTGITNSPRVKELLGDYVEYAQSPADVLLLVEKRKHDLVWRQKAMRHVAENHTFLQRVRDLARIIKVGRYTTTCVSALYDIGREAIDRRSISDYIKWTESTLKTIKDPFVLYLDKKLGLKDRCIQLRSTIGPIQIIETELSDIPMWIYYNQVKSIVDSSSNIKYPNDITNRLPYYVLIQYSKFFWLEKTMFTNPFEATQFAWIDAGFSRFYPIDKLYESVATETNNFYCKVNSRESWIQTLNPDTYIGTNECILHGFLWIVHPETFSIIKHEVIRIWEVEMMAKKRLDNEQIALALACKKLRSYFELISDSGTGTPGIFSTFFKEQ